MWKMCWILGNIVSNWHDIMIEIEVVHQLHNAKMGQRGTSFLGTTQVFVVIRRNNGANLSFKSLFLSCFDRFCCSRNKLNKLTKILLLLKSKRLATTITVVAFNNWLSSLNFLPLSYEMLLSIGGGVSVRECNAKPKTSKVVYCDT